MPSFASVLTVIFAVCLWGLAAPSGARAEERDQTCFQIGGAYLPQVDAGSDVAIVYGVGPDFAERTKAWRDKGYTASLMTGISWGGYGAYYSTPTGLKTGEIQTRKNGKLFMHGNSKDVGYNVPTDGYIKFIQEYIAPAVDDGVRGVYLEEPEFWADSGWSEAFKQEWQRFYGEPWQAPDSSVDAQYKASRLKYEMYFKALREVFAFAKKRAGEKGRTIECHVPTHSLVNYAQWRIVSPESHLSDIEQFDGYVAQVWTGTARSENIYRGVTKERTFEAAFLEYGQMAGMVKPTGKKVWFLADPVEDNPNRSWEDYKRNYECTLVASLLWPEVSRYEVMPWPDRIFNGHYRKADAGADASAKAGIPADYATELLVVFNALNDMDQKDVEYYTGTRGVGVMVSDTMMFQRAAPTPSDPRLSGFFGLAMPLVKHGVPVEPVQLENSLHAGCLEPYSVLLMTYEGQKPLKREYHEAIDKWVRAGGGLVFVDDGADPYHGVKEWWNDNGAKPAKAYDDLFARLGVTADADRAPQKVGKGFVRVARQSPTALAGSPEGGDSVLGWVKEMKTALGGDLKTSNRLALRRGPYLVAAVMDESTSADPMSVKGNYVDLFDASLTIVTRKDVKADERGLFYDLDWARAHGKRAHVVAAGARVSKEVAADNEITFTLRGPVGTRCNARVLLPKAPKTVSIAPEQALEKRWDEGSGTLWLSLDNLAQDLTMRVAW